MVGSSVEVNRGGLIVNVDKNKVKVLDREVGLEWEILVNGMQLEHVSEFKYLVCVLDEPGTDVAVS